MAGKQVEHLAVLLFESSNSAAAPQSKEIS